MAVIPLSRALRTDYKEPRAKRSMPAPLTDALDHINDAVDIEWSSSTQCNPENIMLSAQRGAFEDDESDNNLWYAGHAVTKCHHSDY